MLSFSTFRTGRDGYLKKSSGRVLGSWLCFRQCFEETSYSSLLHHNFAFISSCYLFCCPANVSWLIGVTLFVSGSRDNWSPDASLAALIAQRTFVTKLVSHFATTIDHNCPAKQGYVEYCSSFETFKTGRAITENVIFPLTRVKSQSKKDPYTGR